MKYIVAHAIRGEAKEAHESITKELTQKFDAFPIHERMDPHLTIKRWFEIDENGLEAVCKTIDTFVASQTQSDYLLQGFGHFGTDVIYVDVKPSAQMLASIHDLMTELRKIPGLTFDEFDDIEGDLHATVAFGALKPFDFDETWNYLQTIKQPDFKIKFDNVVLEKRTEDKWEIDRTWEIKA